MLGDFAEVFIFGVGDGAVKTDVYFPLPELFGKFEVFGETVKDAVEVILFIDDLPDFVGGTSFVFPGGFFGVATVDYKRFLVFFC